MSSSRKSIPAAVVGLDIGNSSIKLVEAKYAKGDITITGIAIADLPEGSIENEVIVDPEGVGTLVKNLLAENNIKTKNCVCAVAGLSKVILRVVEVPKMTKAELADTMKWQVESNVPFPADDIVMDYGLLQKDSADPNDPNVDVLFAAAQQDIINSYIAMLKVAGLKPMALDVDALASGRALLNASKDESDLGNTVGIVDIGSAITELGVFENGTLVYPNPPLSIAGNALTAEIAQSLDQSFAEAEVAKKEYAFVDEASFADMAESDDFEENTEEFSDDFGDIFSTFDESPVAPGFDTGASDEILVVTENPTSDADIAPEVPSFGMDSLDIPDGPVFDFGGIPADPAAEASEEENEGQEALSDNSSAELAVVEPKEDTLAPNSLQGKIVASIASPLIDLANELRRAIEYYDTRYNKTINKIYLYGGTAKLPKLDEFLSRELGVDVVIADPLKNFNVNVPNATEQYLKEVSPVLTVSLGLAIRDMVE